MTFLFENSFSSADEIERRLAEVLGRFEDGLSPKALVYEIIKIKNAYPHSQAMILPLYLKISHTLIFRASPLKPMGELVRELKYLDPGGFWIDPEWF